MRTCPFLFILGLLSSSVFGQVSQQKIKLLSWNIFMLPKLAAKSSPSKRANAIGQLLKASDYDVIVFQEAFSRKSRRIIKGYVKESFPYIAGPANQKFWTWKTNSGIWILSKLPITSTHSIIYDTYSGMDAFSRKGAMLAEISLGTKKIQVIGTHLQSAGGQERRKAQCQQLYRQLLLPLTKDSVPQIICGDLNIDRYEYNSTYSSMLQFLNSKDGTLQKHSVFSFDPHTNDLTLDSCKRSKLIDYILIGNNGAFANVTNYKITPLRKKWSDIHSDLSDHYAVEAEININSIGDSLQFEHKAKLENTQDQAISGNNHYELQQPKSLGFYIAPEYQHFKNIPLTVPIVGLSAGSIINYKWRVGISYFRTFDRSRYSNTAVANARKLNVHLAGLTFDYTFFERKKIRLSFPVMLGVGSVSIDSSQVAVNQSGNRIVNTEKRVWEKGSFFKPGLNIDFSITKQCKVFIGTSIIIFTDSDINTPGHSMENQLKNISFNAGLRFDLLH